MCPEIEKLESIKALYNASVTKISESPDGLIEIEFFADFRLWRIYIEDEYEDFDEKNQLLCIFLVLKALEDFAATDDYHGWCNVYGLEASDTVWLHYYRELPTHYAEIEHLFGSISSFISKDDYEMRTGCFGELLQV